MTASWDVNDWKERLSENGYIAEPSLAATLNLFHQLGRPLLLEGDAGVGKTEIARVLSLIYDCPLIRLQCYEGLDVNTAVYEWNYQHQLLNIKLMEQEGRTKGLEEQIFSERFLLKRPLLQAISQPSSPVLLIDEIDRADEEFEAFLLELLSDFQISVPEIGTIKAKSRPFVILTSNGTRELSDALRRRCLYYYVEYPEFDKELRIVNAKLPELGPKLTRQLVSFIQDLRTTDLRKTPGIAETLDWAAALLSLGINSLDQDLDRLADSLVCLLKTREDNAALPLQDLERRVIKAL